MGKKFNPLARRSGMFYELLKGMSIVNSGRSIKSIEKNVPNSSYESEEQEYD